MESWSEPAYYQTLGMSQDKYMEYQQADEASIVPENAVIFNPGKIRFDKPFLQSLVGFELEWRAESSALDRELYYPFISILGIMQYEEDLGLTEDQLRLLETWRATGSPEILQDVGIDFIICRTEHAQPTLKHCPQRVFSHDGYSLVQTWNLDSMFEEYSLFQLDR